MVANVNSGYSIRRIFNYNENKVAQERAMCIAAFGYPMDLHKLTLSQKLNRLLNQASLRPSLRRHAIHISLSFSPLEKQRMEDNTLLCSIAEEYMRQIGFGEQPYLVYRHNDTNHPHIHIVTLKIDANGNPVKTQNIGRNESRKACLTLEKKYQLVSTEQTQPKELSIPKSLPLGIVNYGEFPTRQAIGNILDHVLESYKYTSMAELNAVLGIYNVRADPGSENSRVYKHKGLLYQIADQEGNRYGKPIKASSYHNNPGLPFLQRQFQRNKSIRKKDVAKLKSTVAFALFKWTVTDIMELKSELQKTGVDLVIRKNKDRIYGLTYVDHRTKLVCNGNRLGKNYSAAAVMKQCQNNAIAQQERDQRALTNRNSPSYPVKPVIQTPLLPLPDDAIENISEITEILMRTEYSPDTLPYHLRNRRKRKKKNRDQSI